MFSVLSTPIGVVVGWEAHPTAGFNFLFQVDFEESSTGANKGVSGCLKINKRYQYGKIS
ncbi:MAG: hypothetical protein IKI11_07275 [Neisseriaceae bacterium]|nr:hypothetical protein [Neisseriaceae bacterium]